MSSASVWFHCLLRKSVLDWKKKSGTSLSVMLN